MAFTVLLTGLSGSGKTTLAAQVAARLKSLEARVEILDGDSVRSTICSDLGFSKNDRIENLRRVGHVATLLARNGIVVLISMIAPYNESRVQLRDFHHRCGLDFFEVYLSTPVEICRDRDPKGLYARAAQGGVPAMTGDGDVYEAPTRPELTLDTSKFDLQTSVEMFMRALEARGLMDALGAHRSSKR